MSVLVEDGHKTTYPLNHARILYRSVATAATATGEQTNYPAAAALTKTTSERWRPLVTGDSLTVTFPAQRINSIALAAHSDLTPTVEVRVDGVWQTVSAYPPAGESLDMDFAADEYQVLEYSPDNEAILFLIKQRTADAVRITVDYDGTAPSLGVVMVGNVLEMHRPFYGGHEPALLSSDSTVQPNVSESGEWLGASQIRQGRPVNMSWDNLPAAWVRKHWHPFSVGIKTNPFVVAWNPLRASADAIYCSSSEVPRPRNSGTRDLQSVSLTARGYSDGTDPVVRPLADVGLLDLLTFTRASEATYYDADGVLRTAIVDEPRLTHDPETGEALGLLIEEERTNLLLWNRDLNSASWTRASVSASLDAVGIDGAINSAWTITDAETSLTSRVFQDFSVLGGSEANTCSAYVKKGSGDEDNGFPAVRVDLMGGTPLSVLVTIDTRDGSAMSAAGFDDGAFLVEDAGGYWRLSITIENNSSGNTEGRLSLYPAWSSSQGGAFSASATGSMVYDYGQAEVGAFPTSPIKTEGSQVTREADNASVDTLAPWFNAAGGTLSVESRYLGDNATDGGVFAVSDGTTSNFIAILFEPSSSTGGSSDRISAFVRTGTGTVFQINSTVVGSDNLLHKAAVCWDSSEFKLAVDGVFVGSLMHGGVPGVNVLDGRGRTFGENAITRSIRYDPRTLSDTELEALTAP